MNGKDPEPQPRLCLLGSPGNGGDGDADGGGGSWRLCRAHCGQGEFSALSAILMPVVLLLFSH